MGFWIKRRNTRSEREARRPPRQRVVNAMVIFILGCMAALTSACFCAYLVWNEHHDKTLWYLCREYDSAGGSPGVPALLRENCESTEDAYPAWGMWMTFFILYCNFIPISLYVTIEIINFVQVSEGRARRGAARHERNHSGALTSHPGHVHRSRLRDV